MPPPLTRLVHIDTQRHAIRSVHRCSSHLPLLQRPLEPPPGVRQRGGQQRHAVARLALPGGGRQVALQSGARGQHRPPHGAHHSAQTLPPGLAQCARPSRARDAPQTRLPRLRPVSESVSK
eukprot:1184051-Prorocentrum_minimum.AAC.4